MTFIPQPAPPYDLNSLMKLPYNVLIKEAESQIEQTNDFMVETEREALLCNEELEVINTETHMTISKFVRVAKGTPDKLSLLLMIRKTIQFVVNNFKVVFFKINLIVFTNESKVAKSIYDKINYFKNVVFNFVSANVYGHVF